MLPPTSSGGRTGAHTTDVADSTQKGNAHTSVGHISEGLSQSYPATLGTSALSSVLREPGLLGQPNGQQFDAEVGQPVAHLELRQGSS